MHMGPLRFSSFQTQNEKHLPLTKPLKCKLIQNQSPSQVNERVGSGQWEDADELGGTWAARNAFSYGRGGERGTARPEVLQSLLSTTDRVVQEIDSVEYGLTDIQASLIDFFSIHMYICSVYVSS